MKIAEGCPSSSIIIRVNKSLKCVLLENSDTFVEVDLGQTVISEVCMLINYRNQQSNEHLTFIIEC